MNTFSCLYCGMEQPVKKNCANKFCNNQCQADYRWENVMVPKIESGKCKHTAVLALKKYLRKEQGNFCSGCGLGPYWNGKELCLQLDHIDGDSDNNFPSNLRLLCPNCHTQTDTHGSKGTGNRYRKSNERNLYLQEYKGRVV